MASSISRRRSAPSISMTARYPGSRGKGRRARRLCHLLRHPAEPAGRAANSEKSHHAGIAPRGLCLDGHGGEYVSPSRSVSGLRPGWRRPPRPASWRHLGRHRQPDCDARKGCRTQLVRRQHRRPFPLTNGPAEEKARSMHSTPRGSARFTKAMPTTCRNPRSSWRGRPTRGPVPDIPARRRARSATPDRC